MFPFKTALNASTLFPFELDIPAQAEVAARAGFEGLEVWVKDIDAYVAAGGALSELRARVADTGVALVNAIAFFAWADADASARGRALEQAKREMATLAEIGCAAVAAPPFGQVAGVTLEQMGERFAALWEVGRGAGVEPYLEFWGRAAQLSQLGQARRVAEASGVAGARLLLDPFHMYTGGSEVAEVAGLSGAAIGIVHVNDYPAAPERGEVTDRERLFPGEGVAPSEELARLLHRAGYRGFLSLELFAESYGGAGPEEVARRGMAAMLSAYDVGG